MLIYYQLEKLRKANALVAQLDRAFGYEPKGQGFESLRAHHLFYREVAQLGRAFGLGPKGCRFKSCLPDHLVYNPLVSKRFFVAKKQPNVKNR